MARVKYFNLLKMEETNKLAKKLLFDLKDQSNEKNAKVICLYGDLGAGKTTFTQSFAYVAGIEEKVVSPTFVIERIYKFPSDSFLYPKYKQLIHIDAYRLSSEKDLEVLDWGEKISQSENIIFIEWPENIDKALPKNYLKIYFDHQNGGGRSIHMDYGEKRQ